MQRIREEGGRNQAREPGPHVAERRRLGLEPQHIGELQSERAEANRSLSGPVDHPAREAAPVEEQLEKIRIGAEEIIREDELRAKRLEEIRELVEGTSVRGAKLRQAFEAVVL